MAAHRLPGARNRTMTLSPEISVLGGFLVLLIVLAVVVSWSLRRGRPMAAANPEGIGPWVVEGRRLFTHWQERIEQLDELKSRLSGMAQEIEQLRAELGQIDEMRAQIARLVEESERYRDERDRFREALGRIGRLAHEAAALESPEAPPAADAS